jgi:hypothetical protein
VQLSNLLSDPGGVNGMSNNQAILDGERDPRELAAWVEPEVEYTPGRRLPRAWGELANGIVVLAAHTQDSIGSIRRRSPIATRVAETPGAIGLQARSKTQPIYPRHKGKKKHSQNPPASTLAPSYIGLQASTGHKSTASMF